MSLVYFISDLHFGHKGILSFGQRSGIQLRSGTDHRENMNNIADNWRNIITKRDHVFVLGDVAFDSEGFLLLKSLPGRKTLVRGNHDDKFTTQDWLTIFDSVESMVKYKGYWLTHCPIHPNELWGKKNIHGHVHFNSVKKDDDSYDDRYVNVCCEAIGEKPILFSEIKNGNYDKARLC